MLSIITGALGVNPAPSIVTNAPHTAVSGVTVNVAADTEPTKATSIMAAIITFSVFLTFPLSLPFFFIPFIITPPALLPSRYTKRRTEAD